MAEEASLRPALEAIRLRLLDLTRRNRLLNHRTGGRASLAIVDERPEHLYRILVDERRGMHFLSREEAPEDSPVAAQPVPPSTLTPSLPPPPDAASGTPPDSPPPAPAFGTSPPASDSRAPAAEGPGAAIPAPPPALRPLPSLDVPAGRHTDRALQTELASADLEDRLLHLARQARLATEEMGCNILHVALGMVEWRENAASPASRAPLLLLPVALERANVRSRFTVGLLDEDVFVNPNLLELCKRIFRLELPSPPLDESFDLAAYLHAVSLALAPLQGWRVLSEVHLGLFSFSKLLMFRDLDPDLWPGGRLEKHPLLRRLTGVAPGEAGPAAPLPDAATLDETVPPEECFQVLDADSSQQVAILGAKRGVSMVIDGPPGTGKSQTIANIVAECLAAGRTVLFVAEKEAALRVVESRLRNVGLGDFVLNVHSRNMSKRAVLDELQRTLEAAPARVAAAGGQGRELEETRARLNAYVRALHAPAGELGETPFAAIARAVKLRAAPEVAGAIPDVLSWTPVRLREAREKLEALERRLLRVGAPAKNPWNGCGLSEAPLLVQQRVKEAALRLQEAFRDLRAAAGRLAGLLGAAAPGSAAGAATLLSAADAILALPRLAPETLADPRWDSPDPSLDAWISAGLERERRKTVWSAFFPASAEEEEWREVGERRRRCKDSLLRLLYPSWHRDTKRIRAANPAAALPARDEQSRLLQALVESLVLRRSVEAGSFGVLFPGLWRGVDSDWAALRAYADAATAARSRIRAGTLAAEAARRILVEGDRGPLAAAAREAREQMERAAGAAREWLLAIASDEPRWFSGSWASASLEAQETRLAGLPAAMEALTEWAGFQAAMQGCRGAGLDPFVDWALSGGGGRLADAFERQFRRLWIDAAVAGRPALREFSGEDHEALLDRFRKLDREWIDATRERLRAKVAAARPSAAFSAHPQSKLGIVQAEIRKKRCNLPLRVLFAQAHEVLQAIKPCFMMSPISVSQYLQPGAMEFDVVIFDEASQVEPADAYGAIARGRQLILVGDEKQLPPTTFFQKIESGDGLEAAETDLAVTDLESILGVGIVGLPQRCALRWHYRSRHDSLIEFSNRRFYNGSLRIFPSPRRDRDELGLAFRFVEGAVYARGAGQHNLVEARAVAGEVMRHAASHPGKSLGVGAFSVAQQRAIEDEIELLRRADPSLERFFAEGGPEPFFVKNLETIQGDERDVIFLSVGYGRDENGRVTLNLGPLNQKDGWRRLNVLVTRARERCLLFSSIRAEEMRIDGTQAPGVVALRDYLHAAEQGRVEETPRPGGEHESPFEADVAAALRERGHEVHAQVGAAGFSIDLAVVDPARPGRYLLGIECDGATYHASPTARDRDRLRQSVLENLGWKIHRIWSGDWLRRRESVLASTLRLVEGLARAAATADPAPDPRPESARSASAAPPPVAVPARAEPAAPADSPEVIPYRRAPERILGDQAALLSAPAERVARRLREIVEAEGPIHLEEALRSLARSYATNASPRSSEAFRRAVDFAQGQGWLRIRGDFLWSAGMEEPPVRHRGPDCPIRRPEAIAPEEIAAAIRLTLRREFGLPRDGLIERTARMMGFQRTGAGIASEFSKVVDALMQSGEVRADAQGFLALAGRR